MTERTLTDIEERKALRAIRRLSCSDLPLYPLLTALGEVLEGAIPSGSLRGWFSVSDGRPTIVVEGVDLLRWAPVWERFRVRGTREESGLLLYRDLARTRKRVLSQEEFALPNFHRSPAYEALYRPLDAEYFLVAPLRSQGRFLGYMNITRPRTSRGFLEREAAFLSRAAPFLSHAMAVRDPSLSLPAGGQGISGALLRTRGLIVADDRGKILSIDPEARRLLGQLSFLSHAGDLPSPTGPWEALDRSLQRIVLSINRIGTGVADPSDGFSVPEECLYRHPSGLSLTVRGYRMMEAGEGGGPIGIVLEETVPDETRHRRLALLYGLSPTEGRIVRLLSENKTRKEITQALSIRETTLRTLLRRILDKMEIEGVGELRDFLRNSGRPAPGIGTLPA
jgi:DNA-binding CsgD family transcriptional regulator/PAS domain-containing protein